MSTVGGVRLQGLVPVVVVAGEGDGLPRLPLGELERTGAVHAARRVAVVGAGRSEGRSRLDHAGRSAHREVELRVGLRGRHRHLAVAGLLDRRHVLVHGVPGRADGGIEVATHRDDHVVGGERGSVVEGHAVADRVDPRRRSRMRERLGKSRSQRVVGVQAQQRLADVGEHLVVGVVERVRVVQGVGLGVAHPAERVDVCGRRRGLIGERPVDRLVSLRRRRRASGERDAGDHRAGDQRGRATGGVGVGHDSSSAWSEGPEWTSAPSIQVDVTVARWI